MARQINLKAKIVFSNGFAYIGRETVGAIIGGYGKPAVFKPHPKCPAELAQEYEAKGIHELRRKMRQVQEGIPVPVIETDPIPLPVGEDPRATIALIARDLIKSSATDRRAGRRLLGALDALWAEDGADLSD